MPGLPVDFWSNVAVVQRTPVETGADGAAETIVTALQTGSGVVRATAGAYTAVRVLTVGAGRNYLPLATR